MTLTYDADTLQRHRNWLTMGKKRSSSSPKSSSPTSTGESTIVLYDRVAQDAKLARLAKERDNKIARAEEEAGIAAFRIMCQEAAVKILGPGAMLRFGPGADARLQQEHKNDGKVKVFYHLLVARGDTSLKSDVEAKTRAAEAEYTRQAMRVMQGLD